jgi:hypothetical protein
LLRKIQKPLRRRDVAFQCGDLIVVGAAGGEVVGHILKRGLDRLSYCATLMSSDRRNVEARPEPSALEDWHRDRRDEAQASEAPWNNADSAVLSKP